MKYETPELTVLTPAIGAIRRVKGEPFNFLDPITFLTEYASAAYEDWE
jgi:hypothetical protein